MKFVKYMTYTLGLIIAITSCATLQAARVDGPMGDNLFKIAGTTDLQVGDRVALIRETYKEYGRAHDFGNTVILQRKEVGQGRVTKILKDGGVAVAFEPGARPTLGMKVEKI